MPSRSRSHLRAATYIRDASSRIFVPVVPRDDLAYSDGDVVEQRLLDLVRGASDVSLHSREIASAIDDWPTRYHLSAGRAHLLRPLAHRLLGRTLEVGAGCGALTRYLGELGGEVVAVEGSRRRAEIAATRCRDLPHVSVFHDRFERFAPDDRFSAITLVGVLEWAARFGNGAQGPEHLLAHAASLLDDEGVVIVAIENQLGLKYLAGWAEDHLGVAMHGVSDVYTAGEPRTFALNDLTGLLQSAGLVHQAVLTPFPDYKLPRVVISPEGLEHASWREDLAALVAATPVADGQAPTLPLFSLERTLSLVARNGLLKGLANSFLVVASREPLTTPDPSVLAWHYSGERRLPFQVESRFRRTRNGIKVEREPLVPDVDGADSGRVRHRRSEGPFERGELWIDRLGGLINRAGWTVSDVAAWAAPWRDVLAKTAGLHRPAAAAHVPARLVDATPFNLVVADGDFRFFDLEWEPEWRVEYGFTVFRGVFWSLSRFRSVAVPAEDVPLGIGELTTRIVEALGTPLQPTDVARYLDLEADLQHDTSGLDVAAARLSLERQRLHARLSLETLAGLPDEAQSLAARHAAANAVLGELRADIERLHEARRDDAVRHVEALDLRAEQQRQALADQEEQYRQAVAANDERHRETLAEQDRQYREALAEQDRQHREALAEQDRQHREALAEQDRQHREALAEQDDRHRLALEQAVLSHARERADLEDRAAALGRELSDALSAWEQADASREALASRLGAAEAARETTAADLAAAVAARDAARRALDESRAREGRLREEMAALQMVARETDARLRHTQQLLDRHRHEQEVETRALLDRVASMSAEPAAGPPMVESQTHRALSRTRAFARQGARHPARAVLRAVRRQRRTFRTQAHLLESSGLFDADYYRSRTGLPPSVDLVARFLFGGDLAGESPHRLFDPAWYRGRYPDIGETMPPLMHYLRSGGWELRDPHPLFEARHYVDQWSPGTPGGTTPLSHFLRTGGVVAASPHPLFDARYYFAQRPDLERLAINPLLHYLTSGHAEGLDPHRLFSTRFYVEQAGDLGGLSALEHFVRHGASEGRAPHPLFDVRHYWRQRPDVREAGDNALVHYLRFGHREGVDPHPLFDTRYYDAQTGGTGDRHLPGLEHYLRWGWRDGLRPNPWFDPRWYLERNPDLVGIEPLQHFVRWGWREDRDPSPAFSLDGYLAHNPEVAATAQNALEHYLLVGRADGRLPDGPRPPVARPLSSTLRVSGRAALAPTVLVVSHVSPWPVGAGNEYRLARLLAHLRQQAYRLVLVLSPLPGDALAPGTVDRLADAYGNVVVCDHEGRIEYRFADHPDVLQGLAKDPTSLIVPFEPGPDLNYCHDVLMAIVKRLAESVGPAAIVAEYIFMTRIFSVVPGGMFRVVDTIDVFSQKGSNVIAYGVGDIETPASEEARLLNRADLVVAIHDGDAAALRRLVPQRDVVVAGVDADVRTLGPWPARPVVLLPGSGNALNVAGLRDFLKLAWPRVKTALPDAELRVAGKVGRAVAPATKGVIALGHVPDLSAEYDGARLVINPAVAGTGLKIKAVEALAHLRPVVGWPHNRDGLSTSLSAFVHEATDWQDFADAVVAGLQRTSSPFTPEAVQAVTTALAPSTVYEALDRRLRRFFDGVGAAQDDDR